MTSRRANYCDEAKARITKLKRLAQPLPPSRRPRASHVHFIVHVQRFAAGRAEGAGHGQTRE